MPKVMGQIFQGIFVADQQEFMKKLEGKRCTLKVISGRRSTQQSRYYFGVVIPLIAAELGYSPEETHLVLKGELLSKPVELNKKKQTHIMRIASTTELSTVQMEKYLKRCRDWALEFLDCFIPLPSEKDLY